LAGTGQVSIGQTIVKANARKVRRLGKGREGSGDVIGGFAGATPTPSRCSSGWRRSSSSIPASSCAPRSSSPRGGWRTTGTCARSSHDIVADKEVSLVLTGTGGLL